MNKTTIITIAALFFYFCAFAQEAKNKEESLLLSFQKFSFRPHKRGFLSIVNYGPSSFIWSQFTKLKKDIWRSKSKIRLKIGFQLPQTVLPQSETQSLLLKENRASFILMKSPKMVNKRSQGEILTVWISNYKSLLHRAAHKCIEINRLQNKVIWWSGRFKLHVNLRIQVNKLRSSIVQT